ncbi:hypothetical protein C8E97_0945 [Saccharothrix australiensis]|uniref:Bifunctional DNA primase/polymerase-like protein n=2 Tax=Saccharothrix australiensis TaxID=2072 RepID=A0A495VVP0_9PSEU|nr:hypothetical protein C8E97_0945 [Saccharothrix australiensis]
MTSGLECALACVDRGWPVIPGALWHRDNYMDPVFGREHESLDLCPADMAVSDEEWVRRWWPVLPSRLMRSTLVVTTANLVGVALELNRAQHIVEREAFQADPTPVVVVPAFEHPAVFLLSSSRGLSGEEVLPVGSTVPLPPAMIEGREVTWLSPMAECEALMAGEQLALLMM